MVGLVVRGVGSPFVQVTGVCERLVDLNPLNLRLCLATEPIFNVNKQTPTKFYKRKVVLTLQMSHQFQKLL